jgi:hypothetical protein
MGCHAIGQIEHDIIDIAPAPTFGWIVAFDNRMADRVEMFGCVSMRRVVATSHMPTSAAYSKMNPVASHDEAFLATRCTWRDVADAIQVSAMQGSIFCHGYTV